MQSQAVERGVNPLCANDFRHFREPLECPIDIQPSIAPARFDIQVSENRCVKFSQKEIYENQSIVWSAIGSRFNDSDLCRGFRIYWNSAATVAGGASRTPSRPRLCVGTGILGSPWSSLPLGQRPLGTCVRTKAHTGPTLITITMIRAGSSMMDIGIMKTTKTIGTTTTTTVTRSLKGINCEERSGPDPWRFFTFALLFSD